MNRNKDYEQNFRSYMFNGDLDRYIEICKDIGILNNIEALQEAQNE